MSDYFYSSARVRALENGLLGREDLVNLAERASVESIVSSLAERGWEIVRDENGGYAREATLLKRLKQAYREILELTDDVQTTVFEIWRYPYDCNNLKAAIKCFLRRVDPTHLMLDFGTVEIDEIKHAVETNEYAALPAVFAEAAREAVDSYAKNKNPQLIDVIIDRACYRAMLDAADASGVVYAVDLVRTRIDLTNLVMCVRVKRMQSGESGRILLADSLLEGGTINHTDLMEMYDAEESAFWERLHYTDYKRFAESVSSTHPTLTEVERAADNVWLARVKDAKFIPCGPEVLIGYLLAVENDVRNLRIILAGRAAGLSAESIMERIRESYV